ncbi:MAG: hypothetical protein OEQ53_23000, partial [Saprospiraceae bacterium]|nr:hypothetical protein [Saprospiraceae bacterium]
KTLQELNEHLTAPSPGLISDIAELNGDILILGIGGKMGPSLGVLARRALDAVKKDANVFGISRFSNKEVQEQLEHSGIKTIAGDLLDEDFLASLPKSENVIFMAGQKFGTQDGEPFTWAMNTYLPGRIAHYFRKSRIVVFSTGNIYPLVSIDSGGASEKMRPGPLGEYAQSCLGRERIFQHFASIHQTPLLIFRLNYALDLRYGVLSDVARAVWNEDPIDLTMGYVNVIWQGDANTYALRSLLHCNCPSTVLNITGPETIAIRWLAEEFGRLLNREPNFVSAPAQTALLSNATEAYERFGKPNVPLTDMIQWTADWIESGGTDLNKPTHFQERQGKF